VGEDFTPEHEAVLTRRGIDTRGIERAKGLSFHWTGSYVGNLDEAKTLGTDLNVFETFEPKIPDVYTDSEYLFLANIDPVLQARVRSQMPNVRMVCGDTMNYWIADHAANLAKVLRDLDVLLINDGEARMLAGERNLVVAAEKVLSMGPKTLVVKHGEYGATAFFGDRSFGGKTKITHPFRAPALPLAEVVDPTGAGDSFAGGFYGYLASQAELTPAVFRKAMFYGGVMGSFAVERFGTERLQAVTRQEIDERFKLFMEISHLEHAGA
jgi:sugar/nucleoside kinase (ribokinase family)